MRLPFPRAALPWWRAGLAAWEPWHLNKVLTQIKNHPLGSIAVRGVAQLCFSVYFAHHSATGKIICFLQIKQKSFFFFSLAVLESSIHQEKDSAHCILIWIVYHIFFSGYSINSTSRFLKQTQNCIYLLLWWWWYLHKKTRLFLKPEHKNCPQTIKFPLLLHLTALRGLMAQHLWKQMCTAECSEDQYRLGQFGPGRKNLPEPRVHHGEKAATKCHCKYLPPSVNHRCPEGQ